MNLCIHQIVHNWIAILAEPNKPSANRHKFIVKRPYASESSNPCADSTMRRTNKTNQKCFRLALTRNCILIWDRPNGFVCFLLVVVDAVVVVIIAPCRRLRFNARRTEKK